MLNRKKLSEALTIHYNTIANWEAEGMPFFLEERTDNRLREHLYDIEDVLSWLADNGKAKIVNDYLWRKQNDAAQ